MKLHPLFFTFVGLLLATCISAQKVSENRNLPKPLESSGKTSFNIVDFQNPPKTFRLLAFWSWNEKLEEPELRRQIKLMDEGGWGGFFMHARPGLITEYFSNDWFKCVKASVDEAKKRGMEAWIYDDKNWPSCTGNFTLAFKDIAYRETHLFVAVDSIPHAKNDITVYKSQKIASADGNMHTYYFYKWKAPLGNPRWHGGSYVDLLNSDVTDEFIKYSYEKYKTAIGSSFGTTTPGAFTDDLNIIWDLKQIKTLAVPWTDKMPEIFKAMNGYSIEDNVEKLYLPLAGYEKVRIDFYRTVNKLFSENYWKKIYDWCGANNLKLTGHHMGDGLPFTDLMQDMQYEHVPAVDLLSYSIGQHLRTLRAITSIANQMGKERTMCEAFAATGQNVSFEDQKNMSNYLFVNGINTITAHIYQYSLMGDRKRDHPATMSHQQPWWSVNKYMADYQARCSYLLSRGKRVSNILLLYPVESFGLVYTPNDRKAYTELSDKFDNTVDYLLQNQLDFDLGSEEIISKYGAVKEAKFNVGLADYTAVVLPAIKTIRQTTLSLIQQYIKNGGVVFATEQLPAYVDGKLITESQKAMFSGIKMISQKELKQQLAPIQKPVFEINSLNEKSLSSIRYSVRQDKNQFYYFVANIDEKNEFSTQVSVNGIGKLYMLDLSTGKKTPVAYRTENGRTITNMTFAPCQSVALVLDADVQKEIVKETDNSKKQYTQLLKLDGDWHLKLSNSNAITLDYCSYSSDGVKFSKPVYVLDMADKMRKDTAVNNVRYSFNSAIDSSDSCFFAIEEPEKYSIKINGKTVESLNSSAYIDKSFRKIPLGAIRKGENYIDLKLKKKSSVNYESVYVIGNFGVDGLPKNQFQLVFPKKVVTANDLAKQGLPFYAGSAELSKVVNLKGIKPNDKLILKFDNVTATVAEVKINGKLAGAVCWQPYELNVSGLLKNGENNIQITLTNTLHNMLGYHHSSTRDKHVWIMAGDFNDKKNWTDAYYLVPFGFEGGVIEKLK